MTVNDSFTLDSSADNPNTKWAQIFVDELARCGLRDVCIAPGSRSTPLTLAFEAHRSIQVHLHLDERSAGFYGLGLALAKDEPVALVCTSGTAAVNFHPAVVEARYSQVPLLVLTADRPPELRFSGANQTIDQIKMYGEHVLWSVDVALPQADAPTVTLRNLQTMAARAFAKSDGLIKGPVHLNFPFRKPLEPARRQEAELAVAEGSSASGQSASSLSSTPYAQRPDSVESLPFTQLARGIVTPTPQQIGALAAIVEGGERGVIVCGPRCPGGRFPELASALSRKTGYPLFADPLSGLRFGPHLEKHAIIGAYETFLAGEPLWQEPEVVIRFGNVATSKALNTYLDRISPIHRVHVSGNGEWADDIHRVTHFLHADATITCERLLDSLEPRPHSKWTQRVLDVEFDCWQAIDDALQGEYFDGAVLADIVAAMPVEASLFAGNSLPVRHLDQFGRPHVKSIDVYANRGASGIDGNISTALGIAAAKKTPLVAVLGDITFYHDMNGLLAVRESGVGVTIVLLNNNGGGIFRRLPIRQYDPPFTQLFLTPHGLDFEPAARMYGLDFVRVEDRASFREALSGSLRDRRPRVIEVKSDGTRDYARWLEVKTAVADRLHNQFAPVEAP